MTDKPISPLRQRFAVAVLVRHAEDLPFPSGHASAVSPVTRPSWLSDLLQSLLDGHCRRRH